MIDADHLISGTPGNVCSFSNGIGSCAAGVCTYSSCNSGWSLGSNKCTAIDVTSDVRPFVREAHHLRFSMLTLEFTQANNCGTLDKKCPTSYAFGGAGYCGASVCMSNCITGYVSVDANS